ncbi:uncharacterized protein [Oscarella lobularis]|uniref:uncharacterized protein n=1 Tax=Oscarella lobularis TaxID=121494 RepID=UPI003313FDD3
METKHDRTVVFVGEAGAGKSSCANSLAGRMLFPTDECPNNRKESDMTSKLPICHKGVEYQIRIVDTIGLDDPAVTTEEILTQLSRSVCECKEGINAVFFVIGKRFTKADANNFDILWKTIGEGILPVTTVVRTNFRKFDDEMAVKEDISTLRKQEGPPKKFFEKLGSRILYVDNNPDKRVSMQKSGGVMLDYLVNHCKTKIVPPAFDEVRKRISLRIDLGQKLKAQIESPKPLKSARSSLEPGGHATKATVEAVDVKQQGISEEDVKKVLSVLKSQAKAEGNEFTLKAWISASLEKGGEAVDMTIVEELGEMLKKGDEGMDRAEKLLESLQLTAGQCEAWLKNAAEQNCIVM